MDLIKELEQASQNGSGRGGAKVQFNRQQTAIREALTAGYSKKDIWKLMREKGDFTYSYAQFLNYARDLERVHEYR